MKEVTKKGNKTQITKGEEITRQTNKKTVSTAREVTMKPTTTVEGRTQRLDSPTGVGSAGTLARAGSSRKVRVLDPIKARLR